MIGYFAALFIFGLTIVVFYIFSQRRKALFQKNIAETDLKALRAQMNPHFIFNSLQSIQNFITKNDPENAEGYLIKFSKLIRLILENSQYQNVSLESDLKALELYMQLESIRLNHPFKYEIIVEEEIDQAKVMVPPLILQPFVENAIWHGLQPKNEPGKITIRIFKKQEFLVFEVEDNGVGRDNVEKVVTLSGEKKQSLGMKLTKERIEIISKIKNMPVYFGIVDLKDESERSLGTKVELKLPFEVS